MKNLFFSFLIIIISFLMSSCENKEAIKKYEQEKQAFEIMKREHRRERQTAIAMGEPECAILLMEIEHAKTEMEQANRVAELAKEAGIK